MNVELLMATDGTGARGSSTSAGTVVPLSTWMTTALGAVVVGGSGSPGLVEGGSVVAVVVVVAPGRVPLTSLATHSSPGT